MPKYRIQINRECCVSDGLCADRAPDVFELDEDGKPIVKDAGAAWPENLLWIARNCPVDALTIIDEDSGEQLWPREG